MAVDLTSLPRRIILSRKGSDAAWGGRASLRIGTELISLPIPESAARAAAAQEAGTGTRYGDLPRHKHLGALHEHIRDISADHYVHPDPGSPAGAATKAFAGQPGGDRPLWPGRAAERHLRNQEIGPATSSCSSAGSAKRFTKPACGSAPARMSTASGAGLPNRMLQEALKACRNSLGPTSSAYCVSGALRRAKPRLPRTETTHLCPRSARPASSAGTRV